MNLFRFKQITQSKSIKWNSIANFLGRIWSSILSIISIPIFINILGTESFGLIGLYTSLQLVLSFFDLGLSATIQREIAKNIALNKPQQDNKDILRTFEIVYWVIGLLIGLVCYASIDLIIQNWVNAQNLSYVDIRMALVIMTLSFFLRWPISLYTGVLLGLQKQVIQNILLVVAASLRTIGSIAVICFHSPTLNAFLVTQLYANFFEIVVIVIIAWKSLDGRKGLKPIFRFTIFQDVWKFAISFNIVGVLGTILSQADRLVIGRLLPINQLGYYSISNTAAGAMPLISNSVAVAIFPRFSSQVAINEKDALKKNYHDALQVIGFPTIGLALFLTFFSKEVLTLWIKEPLVVDEAWRSLTILSIAFMFNAISNPAYTLLIAYGYTSIPLSVNLINLIIFIPMMFLFIPKWGITAAAAIWLLENLIGFIVYFLYTDLQVLNEPFFRQLGRDVMVYLVVGLLWFGVIRYLSITNNMTAVKTILLALVSGLGYILSILIISKSLLIFPHTFLKSISVRNSTSN